MSSSSSSARAFAAMAALALIACGGGGDADTAGDTTGAATPPPAVTAVNGETEYQNTCAVCHQNDGQGMAGAYPPLAGSHYVNAASPNRMIAIILKGLTGPVTVNNVEYNGIMAAHEQMLSDEQIAAIATYERSSWGNTGSAVTAAQVAEVRTMTASRTTAWTVAELEAAVP
jgi:mono/diheme cytochrome c family protein